MGVKVVLAEITVNIRQKVFLKSTAVSFKFDSSKLEIKTCTKIIF